MGHLPVPRTTHTLELDQLAELNARLKASGTRVTASDLGLGGVPESAVLVRLCWDGPPDYPYVHAHFAAAESGVASDRGEGRPTDLHTASLRRLSRRLGVRQQWGDTGAPG